MIYDLSNAIEKAEFNSKVSLLKSKDAIVELKEKKGSRTLKQNRAIHLYCRMIAETFNEMGATFEFKGIKGVGMELRYTDILVKETLWKPIQMTLFGKKSTTELTRKEVTEVAEHIEMFFAQKGIDLPFPSIENYENNNENNS